MTDKAGYVLVTGGAGYIGSHTVIELLNEDYNVIVIDNLACCVSDPNGFPESINRVHKIVGGEKKVLFFQQDLLDKEAMRQIFQKYKIQAIIHFAALKAVGKSMTDPLNYYRVNVGGTLNLLELMKEFGVYNIILSSSATVYGDTDMLPLNESLPTGSAITNPYGRTKYICEQMMMDLARTNKKFNVICLRYFNPAGAHQSGTIGEDCVGTPHNLIPYATQVAIGRREELLVFGGDYDTHDGTGVRDYCHVVDISVGHVAALRKLRENCGFRVYNLGTGQGYSVLDMVGALEKASKKKIKYRIVDRRPGDVSTCYSSAALAEKELGWKAARNLTMMCEDQWRWQSNNPNGYRDGYPDKNSVEHTTNSV